MKNFFIELQQVCTNFLPISTRHQDLCSYQEIFMMMKFLATLLFVYFELKSAFILFFFIFQRAPFSLKESVR